MMLFGKVDTARTRTGRTAAKKHEKMKKTKRMGFKRASLNTARETYPK
jgi:hypothetical protein